MGDISRRDAQAQRVKENQSGLNFGEALMEDGFTR